MIEKFYWINTGYTHALERISKQNGAYKSIKFNAYVGLLKHTRLGYILFDTGYSPRFTEATKRFPYRLYRMAAPMFQKNEEILSNQLKKIGISPLDIQHLIISHLHADHVASVLDFPNAQLHAHSLTLKLFKEKNGLDAVRHGLLKQLLPIDFIEKTTCIDIVKGADNAFFKEQWDVFKDGSINAFLLPGHARGQIGIEFKINNETIFLVSDAAWHSESIINNILPSKATKLFFDSYSEYSETLKSLQKYHNKHKDIIMVPSHCEIAWQQLKELGYGL